MVRRSSEQATALLRLTPRTTRRSFLRDLHSPRLRPPEMAKREAPSDPDSLAPLVPATLETPLAIRRLPESNLLAMEMIPEALSQENSLAPAI